jgi:hypothetical protein
MSPSDSDLSVQLMLELEHGLDKLGVGHWEAISVL